MSPKELKEFYGWLRDILRDDIGVKAYRALFEGKHTYYGYPLAIGA